MKLSIVALLVLTIAACSAAPTQTEPTATEHSALDSNVLYVPGQLQYGATLPDGDLLATNVSPAASIPTSQYACFYNGPAEGAFPASGNECQYIYPGSDGNWQYHVTVDGSVYGQRSLDFMCIRIGNPSLPTNITAVGVTQRVSAWPGQSASITIFSGQAICGLRGTCGSLAYSNDISSVTQNGNTWTASVHADARDSQSRSTLAGCFSLATSGNVTGTYFVNPWKYQANAPYNGSGVCGLVYMEQGMGTYGGSAVVANTLTGMPTYQQLSNSYGNGWPIAQAQCLFVSPF